MIEGVGEERQSGIRRLNDREGDGRHGEGHRLGRGDRGHLASMEADDVAAVRGATALRSKANPRRSGVPLVYCHASPTHPRVHAVASGLGLAFSLPAARMGARHNAEAEDEKDQGSEGFLLHGQGPAEAPGLRVSR